MKITLVPVAFSCPLGDCPPGPFVYGKNNVGFKTEYRTTEGRMEVYCESGEAYHGDGDVIPCAYEIETES